MPVFVKLFRLYLTLTSICEQLSCVRHLGLPRLNQTVLPLRKDFFHLWDAVTSQLKEKLWSSWGKYLRHLPVAISMRVILALLSYVNAMAEMYSLGYEHYWRLFFHRYVYNIYYATLYAGMIEGFPVAWMSRIHFSHVSGMFGLPSWWTSIFSSAITCHIHNHLI